MTDRQKQIEAGAKDAGLRGAVTGGAQMAVLEELIFDLLKESGIPEGSIYRRKTLEYQAIIDPKNAEIYWLSITIGSTLPLNASPKSSRASETTRIIEATRQSETQNVP
ncbi:MAG TPA: PaeR7I family type II restriction endonuclease [Candidatus Baltobacteraceae bacterium]|nr:PaeR7I family type II restriction endonuclease [Candidatus Baltobacteraceae bacterium]